MPWMVTHHPQDGHQPFQGWSLTKPDSIQLCSLTVSAWTEPQLSPACSYSLDPFYPELLCTTLGNLCCSYLSHRKGVWEGVLVGVLREGGVEGGEGEGEQGAGEVHRVNNC